MKIAFITEVYPPATAKGGIGTYTKELAEELASRGHNIHVYSRGGERISRVVNGVEVHRNNFKNSQRVLNILKFAYWAAKEAKSEDFEIVEAPNYRSQGLFVPYFCGSKYVVRLSMPAFKDDELTMPKLEGLRAIEAKIRYYLENKAVEKADFVISNTKRNLDLVSQHSDVEESKVIPHGISSDSEINDAFSKTILYVGRYDTRKNPDLVAQSVANVCESEEAAEFIFVGGEDKVREKELKHMIPEKFHENVSFEGFVSRERLEQFYREADIFVAPSVWEGFGMIYLEAMSYGLPIIGTSKGGGAEIVDEVGYPVNEGDVEFLSNKLVDLLQDDGKRKELSMKSYQTFSKEYNVETMADRTMSVYRGLVQ